MNRKAAEVVAYVISIVLILLFLALMVGVDVAILRHLV